MLTRRLLAPVADRLAAVTFVALVAAGGAVAGAQLAAPEPDTCAAPIAGLAPEARTLVARRMLACRDYEAGRISKQRYHETIDALDAAFARPASHAPGVMWADAVLGYSTQYTATSWSAAQALGRPDVYPQHGDLPKAWASASPDDHPEWIELGYATPRPVSAIEIYETFNPGAVHTVELITTSGRRIEVLAPDAARDGANKLVLPVTCTSEPIAAVRVNLASQLVTGWNEIDAVGLVPCSER